jgi:hypothetical protein
MRRSTLHLLGWVALLVLLLGGLLDLALARITQVGLVTDVGKVDDRTFNEFAYNGMMRAVKAFGLKSAFIETQQPTDYEKNIEQLASAGYEMIVTVIFMLAITKKILSRCCAIVDLRMTRRQNAIIGLTFAGSSSFRHGALLHDDQDGNRWLDCRRRNP